MVDYIYNHIIFSLLCQLLSINNLTKFRNCAIIYSEVFILTIGERIKMVRESRHLTKTKFGDTIHISISAVTKIENGQNNPSDQTISLICSCFGINKSWLLTGVGEMECPYDRDAEINRIMQGEDEQKKEIFRMLADMPDEYWKLFFDFCAYIKNKK